METHIIIMWLIAKPELKRWRAKKKKSSHICGRKKEIEKKRVVVVD